PPRRLSDSSPASRTPQANPSGPAWPSRPRAATSRRWQRAIWSGRGSGRPGRRGRTTLVAAVVARSDGTWTARPGGAVRGVSMSAGRIIAVVVGALLALFGLG